jgi:hypothetical protein
MSAKQKFVAAFLKDGPSLFFRSIFIIESLFFFNPLIIIVMRNLKSKSN